jgi:hypothetical protein
VLDCLFEEDKLKLTRALQVVLIDFAFKIVDNFFQVLEVLVAGLACLETQNLGEVTVLHLLNLNSFGKTLANCRTVSKKPLSI